MLVMVVDQRSAGQSEPSVMYHVERFTLCSAKLTSSARTLPLSFEHSKRLTVLNLSHSQCQVVGLLKGRLPTTASNAPPAIYFRSMPLRKAERLSPRRLNSTISTSIGCRSGHRDVASVVPWLICTFIGSRMSEIRKCRTKALLITTCAE